MLSVKQVLDDFFLRGDGNICLRKLHATGPPISRIVAPIVETANCCRRPRQYRP
jgi:hypothetical protein